MLQDYAENVQRLAELIKDIRVAMMITVMPDGSLRGRPMATQRTEFDGQLWFFTALDSMKVDEVREQQRVNLSYADPDNQRYVSISGRASVVTDPAKVRELWHPAYVAWFPLGLDDPNLGLICVEVDRAEYWDAPSSKMVHLVGFVKAALTGERYEPGENRKIEL